MEPTTSMTVETPQSGPLYHSLTRTDSGLEPEPEPAFIQKLREAAKFKARSSETHDNNHLPILNAIASAVATAASTADRIENDGENEDRKDNHNKDSTNSYTGFDLVLLGDSMFERLQTTGHGTKLGIENVRNNPRIFNAGVGGDRIVNVVYRLIDKRLLFSLRDIGVKIIALEMGTNDLVADKKAISDADIQVYQLVVQALRWACPGVKVVVCGLNPRRRVKKVGIVEESNEKLRRMVEGMCRETDGDDNDAITHLPSNPDIIDFLDDDGVHLNEEGYQLFVERLWERYQTLRAGHKIQAS